MEVKALTVPEFGRAVREGRSTVYREIKAGRVRSYKVGRARRIPASEVEAYIARALAADAESA